MTPRVFQTGQYAENELIQNNVSMADLFLQIQPLNFDYKQLLNKPYENEVNLTGQNPPSKCTFFP